MAGTDWAKFGLTAELTVVVPKKTADTKLGVTLSSYENDVGHPRIRGEARPFLPAWPLTSSLPSAALWCAELKSGGAAAAANVLRKNDAILQVNGTAVTNDQAASDLIRCSPGDVTFVLRRKPAPELGKKSRSVSSLFKRSSSKKSSKDMVANGAADVPKAAEPPAQTPPPPAAAAEEVVAEEDDELLADATESATLYIARKHGQFGVGVRDDNYVQEVDEGSGAAEAGFLPGDWIISIGGVEVTDYSETLPRLKSIKLDGIAPVVVRYDPAKHPGGRVVPPMPTRAAPKPAPAPAPVPVPVAVPVALPVLSAAQEADGAIVVTLFKPEESSRLGITLTSDGELYGAATPLYVSKLAPGALGAESGQVFVGDQLLQVNDTATTSHKEASALIKAATGDIHLVIVRAPPEPEPTAADATASSAALDAAADGTPVEAPADEAAAAPAAADAPPGGFFDQLGKSTAKLFGLKTDEEKDAEKEAALLASAEEAEQTDAATKLQAYARGLSARTSAAEAQAASREAEAATLEAEAPPLEGDVLGTV